MSVCVALPRAYGAWAAGNVDAVMEHIDGDIVFDVNLPARANSYVGRGYGKEEFSDRLKRLLDDWMVVAFEAEWIKPRGPLWQCAHVRYCYKARRSGHKCDGTMRHHLRVVDGRIVQFELMLDGPKLDAFRRLDQAEADGLDLSDAWPAVRC